MLFPSYLRINPVEKGTRIPIAQPVAVHPENNPATVPISHLVAVNSVKHVAAAPIAKLIAFESHDNFSGVPLSDGHKDNAGKLTSTADLSKAICLAIVNGALFESITFLNVIMYPVVSHNCCRYQNCIPWAIKFLKKFV